MNQNLFCLKLCNRLMKIKKKNTIHSSIIPSKETRNTRNIFKTERLMKKDNVNLRDTRIAGL